MSATTAELRVRVAEKLRVKSVDMELDAETAAKIDNFIQEVTDHLRELGLVWWADGAIPEACVLPMILMVSAWGCADLGKAGQGYEQGFEGGLIRLSAIRPSVVNNTVAVDYF